MKAGFKLVCFTSVVTLLGCSLCGVEECSAGVTAKSVGLIGFLSAFGGSNLANAFPPMFQKRLGSPSPQIGGPSASLEEDEDSDEDEDDLLESRPRVEPQITSMNRDQCLAKLLCGMSVPVTGGNSKKNYYSEYAQIVSKFFEAFPLDEEYQSKESIETYDDYSTEDDDKPNRKNSKRKPLNSSRVEATAPTFQLFDLALVDVAKEGEGDVKNETTTEIEKVSTGNRVARARKIVENLGQKLQTVRQCQSINGCPFTFKQLREKLKKKEAERVASNVPLPGPIWPPNPIRQEVTANPYKPKVRPASKPIPPTSKPESTELFSNEEPIFPYKDTHKGDDEMEEIFGPAPVSKKPLGFHHGIDENFNYEYNPDKPWRPGGNGGNSYGYRPWKPRPYSTKPGANSQQRPRPRPGAPGQKKPAPPPKPLHQHQPQRKQVPATTAQTRAPVKKTPAPPPPTKSPFPKKKISYIGSPYSKPSGSQDDDEESEDINKVAPVELIGNFDAGEKAPTRRPPTTEAPEEPDTTDAPKSKRKDDDDDDSDEYDDDYYNDDDDDEDDLQDDDDVDDDDNYSSSREKKKSKRVKQKKAKPSQGISSPPKASVGGGSSYVDDESEGVSEIWTKLNYATTGANYKPPEKLIKNDDEPKKQNDDKEDASEESDEDEEEEDEARLGPVVAVKPNRIRASSTSTSASAEDDDELDDENASKRKKSKKSTKRSKSGAKTEETTAKPKETGSKGKKSKKKPGKKTPSTENDEKDNMHPKRNPVMIEIGGRPLVPKPESDKSSNAQKTSHLVSNRFKFQFINPYGSGAPQAPPQTLDTSQPGSYTPLRTALPTPASASNAGSSNAGGASQLPFKFKINTGPLGSLAESTGLVGNIGFPSGGLHAGSSSGSTEFNHGVPSHHHYPPQHHQMPHFGEQQGQGQYPPKSGLTGGSGLFKLNPIPALTNLFKRPSSTGYDPMQGGGPPPPHGHPINAFIHRPVGPESSQYRKERPSPASGSSAKKSSKAKGKGKTKKPKW